MFMVDEETADAIRRAWDKDGELTTVVELRWLFPLTTADASAYADLPPSVGVPSLYARVLEAAVLPSHSPNLVQRRRALALRTAMARARLLPTSTTRRLPRVTPV